MTKKQKVILNIARSIKGAKTSTRFVVSAIFAVTSYAVAAFLILKVTGNNISDSLTASWFLFWTAEIVSLASIKNTKTKKGKKKPKEDNQNDVG